jgi:hypothetical protein
MVRPKFGRARQEGRKSDSTILFYDGDKMLCVKVHKRLLAAS